MTNVITELTKCGGCGHRYPDVSFRLHAHSKNNADAVICDSCLWTPAHQRKHEKALIARDRQDAEAERRRLDAEKAVENGGIDFQAAVLGPTPEQLAHGDFMRFGIALERQAARGAHGWKRVVTPIPLRLFNAGKFNERHLEACLWYRNTYDKTGFDGNVRTTDMTKEVFGGQWTVMPIVEKQSEARDEFAFVRNALKPAWVKFFDNVVINDIPVKRASRMSKSGRNPMAVLRMMAEQAADQIDLIKKGLTNVAR